MTRVSRRTFLRTTAAATPMIAWSTQWDALRAAAPLTRYEARTPQGIAMIEKYAKAVAIMKDMNATPAGKPSSWTFQWYTHWTPDSKATELNRIYPGGQPANWRAVADKTWATCQAHFQPFAREQFFLPWHRWYVYYFESIIKEVLHDESFTLPYWNYAQNPVIPEQFTKQNDAKFGSLYNSRGPNVNQGQPIDSALALQNAMHDALCQRRYEFRSDIAQGFCYHLDRNLHGDVHVDLGGDMQTPPTAANDPIFWLHHCNIDRLWASWIASGGKNPTDSAFKNEPFTFADRTGAAVTKTCGGALEIAPLGYQYDRLEPRPADCPLAGPESVAQPTLTHRAPGATTLGVQETRVLLHAVPGREAAASGTHVFLIVKNVSTSAAPTSVYDVFLNAPENASPTDREAARVGSINFFDLVPHGEHRPAENAVFTFDVTRRAQSLARAADVAVTIAPRQPGAAEVRPTVGEIQLVRA